MNDLDNGNITEVEWMYFSCENSAAQNIPWPWVCDHDPDCSDGSDESEELCNNVGQCGHTFTSQYGLLTSPLYPDKYQDDSQ